MPKYISFFFLLLMVTCCINTTTISAQITLTENGESKFQIVIAENASDTEQRAATIMQTYLKQISGARLPVVRDTSPNNGTNEIIVGNTNRNTFGEIRKITAPLKVDGYIIQTLGQNLFIHGGTGKGVIYGVTSFLEDYLGCRKLSPEVEYVPHLPTINIPVINDQQTPPADIRVVNGNFADDVDYKDWRKLNTIADNWREPGFSGFYVHTFNRIVSPSAYFDSHPEYFSLVNGRRIPYGQLCLSNPDVLEITLDRLRKEMEAHPRIQYWSVSQNDTYGNCECTQCKKMDEADGGPIGSLLQFVNQVAAQFPDKTITTLAYQYTRKPPAKTKPANNVMITLCTIELNRSKPIADDPGSAGFHDDIVGWSKICNNIMLWDYEVQFTNYLCPFPLFHTLKPNIQFFNQHGVKAHFQQCNAVHGVEFAPLKTYLLSKLLWNPAIDPDAVIHDFMNAYYGKAASFIRQYFDLLHEEAKKSGQGLDIYGTPVWNAHTFLSQKHISQYYTLFDSAAAAVRDQPALLERVKIDRLCVQYADMEIAKTDMFGERGWYTIDKNGDYSLRQDRRQLLEDFYTTCKRNNVVQLNENGLTSEIYYNNTLRFIDVQVKGDLAFGKNVAYNPMPAPKYSGSGANPLTNGVKGTEDYKINWLGWEGTDIELHLDLQQESGVQEITVSTLQFPKSWITHPLSVTCLVSSDGVQFRESGTISSNNDLRQEPQMKSFTFMPGNMPVRYIKFKVNATKMLPKWHDYNGNKSWLFIDEIIVR